MTTEPPTPVIEFQGVGFAYDGPPVLSQVDFTVGAGDFLAVIGPNGGGKSTLLRLMLGLIGPQQGQVRLLGRAPAKTRDQAGYVPQQAWVDRDFPLMVQDLVLMGRLGPWRPWGRFGAADRELALACLEEVGLAHLARRPFGALSGGQRQRALIARALACRPRVLLLDEPTAGVDVLAEGEFIELLGRFRRRLTILVVSHDLSFVSPLVDRVVCVNRRVAVHPTSALDGAVIQELYGAPVQLVRHDCHLEPEGCGHD